MHWSNYCIKCFPYIYALIGRSKKITSLPKTEFGAHLQQSPNFQTVVHACVRLYYYVDRRGSESLLQLYILYMLDDIILLIVTVHPQILQMVPNNFLLLQGLTKPHQVSNTRLGHTVHGEESGSIYSPP